MAPSKIPVRNLTSVHQRYIREIIGLAEKAYGKGEVPVGAVIVDKSGRIIGRGYNQTHSKKDGLQHAELVAIRSAQARLGDWRLENTSMYVTLEPCLMCLGAIGNARIRNLYYLLPDLLFGSVESKLTKRKVKQLFPKLNVKRLPEGQTVQRMMKDFFNDLRTK